LRNAYFFVGQFRGSEVAKGEKLTRDGLADELDAELANSLIESLEKAETQKVTEAGREAFRIVLGLPSDVDLIGMHAIKMSGDIIHSTGGGKGMRTFYDVMLPSFVKKYARKWGIGPGLSGKVPTKLAASLKVERRGAGLPRIPGTGEAYWAIRERGWHESGPGVLVGHFETQEEAEQEIDRLRGEIKSVTEPIHILPIPDQMRLDLLSKPQSQYEIPVTSQGETIDSPIWASRMRLAMEDRLPNRSTPGKYLALVKKTMSLGRFKESEFKDSGLEDWLEAQDPDAKLTKAQVLNAITASMVPLRETIYQEENHDTVFHGYVLDGGENYKELLLHMDRNDHFRDTFRHEHWPDAKNTLVHIRMDDRVMNGKLTLFIQEVQSDWLQQGEKWGFGAAPQTRPRLATDNGPVPMVTPAPDLVR